MILLIFLASILIITVTIYQYDEQNKEYNIDRFARKEKNVMKRIQTDLDKTSFPVKTENLESIFRSLIFEVACYAELWQFIPQIIFRKDFIDNIHHLLEGLKRFRVLLQ